MLKGILSFTHCFSSLSFSLDFINKAFPNIPFLGDTDSTNSIFYTLNYILNYKFSIPIKR
jgi:hypothetical protein